MWLRIKDCSGDELGDALDIDSVAALEEFVERERTGPVRMWDAQGEGFGLRFALGEDQAGGLWFTLGDDGTGPSWVLAEHRAGAPLEARDRGSTMTIPGRERLQVLRLLDVLRQISQNTGRQPPAALPWEKDPGLVDVDALLAEADRIVAESADD